MTNIPTAWWIVGLLAAGWLLARWGEDEFVEVEFAGEARA